MKPHRVQGTAYPFSRRRADRKINSFEFSSEKIFHFMSCFLPAECKAFLIRLNILQIPGQWVIMSTSIVYFKASLQRLHYLQNTKMTFISQRDKATLGSSASLWGWSGDTGCSAHGFVSASVRGEVGQPVGHRTVKHADSISTGRRAVANARQTSFLCSHLLQILQHWVFWSHLNQPGTGFSCSILSWTLLQNVLPWLLAVSWREGCHSMAGILHRRAAPTS